MEQTAHAILICDHSADPLWSHLSSRPTFVNQMRWTRQSLEEFNADEASLVVAAFDTDQQVAQALSHAKLRLQDGVRLVGLFRDADAAALHDSQPGIEALCSVREIARSAVQNSPPLLQGAVAAPPIVIGDGMLGREIVMSMVTGWGYPGDPFTIHCVGSEVAWAQDAAATSGSCARLIWTETALTPALVVAAVQRLLSHWRPPAEHRGEPAGPTIMVALGDQTLALVLAKALVAAIQDGRVTAIVDEMFSPFPDGVTVIVGSKLTATALEAAALRDRAIERVLLEDLAWAASDSEPSTAPPTPLFHHPVRVHDAPLPLEKQPAQLQDQLRLVAASLPDIFSVANLEAGSDVTLETTPLILAPSELSAMASRILQTLDLESTWGTRVGALELAFRLPRLAARQGIVLRRPKEYFPLLTFEDIERLAPQVHHVYQAAALETENATQSPFAYIHWRGLSEFEQSSNRAAIIGSSIAFAAVGFGWRAVDRPKPLSFSKDQLDQLAAMEHRRWAHHQRANGRANHMWNMDWESLTPKQKRYDELIILAMPGLLGQAGIEVYRKD